MLSTDKRFEELCPQAQELVRLTSHQGNPDNGRDARISVSDLLGGRPDLLAGMDEFLGFCDARTRDISGEGDRSIIGHSMVKKK